MKSIFGILIAMVSVMGSAATIKDMKIPGQFITGVCTYETTLETSSYPDYEIFTNFMNNNWFTKDNFVTESQAGKSSPIYRSFVEEIDKSKYVLHISLSAIVPMNPGECSDRNIRLILR